MQAIYLFDYSKIDAGEYGDYVFKLATQALANSRGTCRFNHGDGSRRNAKELSAHVRSHNGRLLQASLITSATPLTNDEAEFTGGIYLVGMWTDGDANIDLLHVAFNKPDVEGYIGMLEFTDAGYNAETWNGTMRRQLHLLPKMELYNGSRSM